MALPFGVNGPGFCPWAVNSLCGGGWRRFVDMSARGVDRSPGWGSRSLNQCQSAGRPDGSQHPRPEEDHLPRAAADAPRDRRHPEDGGDVPGAEPERAGVDGLRAPELAHPVGRGPGGGLPAGAGAPGSGGGADASGGATGPPRPIEHTSASDPGPEIACGLSELEPLSLAAADGRAEKSQWNELVDRHHPLGCPRPFGPSLRWFILDRDGRRLGHLAGGDIVVFDRGYFSHELLYAVLDTGAHPVFRLQRGNAGPFRAFMDGDARETRLTVSAGEDARRKLAARWPDRHFEPLPLRLVRQRAEQDDEWILATTLTDPGHVSADDLAELHHGRWSIEELYKVSKKVIEVDKFHAQTERGVRQELYAHFNLVAMTRILSGPGDGLLADMRGEAPEPQVANSKNAVAMVAMGLEELFLAQADAIAEAVKRLADGILRVRARLRPGRSYPRESMRPASKWSKRSKTKSKTKSKPA